MGVLGDASTLAGVVRRLDPHADLRRAWPLTGGVSAQMTALEMGLPDGTARKLILRSHGPVDREQNTQIALDEFRLLRHLNNRRLPVPAPVLLDDTCEILPAPYLLLDYVDGEVIDDLADFEPVSAQPRPQRSARDAHSANGTMETFGVLAVEAPAGPPEPLRQLACALARIHRVDLAHPDLAFLRERPQRSAYDSRLEREALETFGILVVDNLAAIPERGFGPRPAVLDDRLQEGRIRDAMERAWPRPVRNAPALLHGDLWPGNVLWRDGRLVAVIDWEDAGIGDPIIDLAKTRLEMLWAIGSDAMQRFTAHYLALQSDLDPTDLPYWDLAAALHPAGRLSTWGLPPEKEARLRRLHHEFVDQAVNRL